MKRHAIKMSMYTAVLSVGVCLVAATALAQDWPGFLGAHRDGHSPDQGLRKSWPEAGPPLLWKVDNVGPGWSSMAVVDDRIYATGNADGQQMLICIDGQGNEQWRVSQGPACSHGKYGGARSTPTVDGDRIYLTGGNGRVTCHRRSDGEIVWKADMKTDMGGKVGGWLYAESVLILGDLAIVTPGGEHAFVALDKHTGQPVWRSNVSAKAGYSSCIPITEDGQTVIVNGTQEGLLVVDALSGQLVHKEEFAVNNTANCPTPAYADGYLFWAVGYGKGSICLKVDRSSGNWSFKEVWKNSDLNCHPGNYVVANGRVFGKAKSGFACVNLQTGETEWKTRVRSGQVCWADGMLYVFADSGGEISLVDPTSFGEVRGSFRVDGIGKSWAHPVVIGGRMLLRYDTNLYCFDVRDSG